jgi:hypothetical protein
MYNITDHIIIICNTNIILIIVIVTMYNITDHIIICNTNIIL